MYTSRRCSSRRRHHEQVLQTHLHHSKIHNQLTSFLLTKVLKIGSVSISQFLKHQVQPNSSTIIKYTSNFRSNRSLIWPNIFLCFEYVIISIYLLYTTLLFTTHSLLPTTISRSLPNIPRATRKIWKPKRPIGTPAMTTATTTRWGGRRTTFTTSRRPATHPKK